MNTLLKRLTHLDADHRLWISLSAGTITYFATNGQMLGQTQWVVAYVVYALTVIALTWTVIIGSSPQDTQLSNRLEDSSRVLILGFVVVAAFASLFTVVLLVKSVKDLSPVLLDQHIMLSIVAVVCSWVLVHTVFIFRYARTYYSDTTRTKGGLNFPGDEEPDYLDFAYFSFVIGMTSQVSDVNITSSVMRRLALIHGVLSFAFNAVIIALSINTISGLIGR